MGWTLPPVQMALNRRGGQEERSAGVVEDKVQSLFFFVLVVGYLALLDIQVSFFLVGDRVLVAG